VVLGMDTNV